ncbi:hypothetical protein Cci01nite_80940 [Catellatospora citrea]|uniref:Uncharacterized protein n=1 Tax=Catellatospora citrea TaxID=53366 RepID=A0A8J3P3U4_9ACTN|nr:hypothetical protein Cci01nite_80940 [Catellatospora citrea]
MYHFDDVSVMTATSDLIVSARVRGVQPGRWIGVKGSPDADQIREVTLEVKSVLFSKIGTPPAVITMDEGAWNPAGDGLQFESVTWTKVGHEGYYFLRASDIPNNYLLVSSQGRVSFDGQKLVSTADEANPIHAALASMSASSLESAIRRAGAEFTAGRLMPAGRFGE